MQLKKALYIIVNSDLSSKQLEIICYEFAPEDTQ